MECGLTSHLSEKLRLGFVLLVVATTSCDSDMRIGQRLAEALTPSAPPVGVPSWQETLGEIAETYPNGELRRINNGETHYRVVAKALGLSPTLVTFCFRGDLGLWLVVVEVLATDAQPNIQTGEYVRPSIDQVTQDLPILRASLLESFGAPTHLRGSPESGGLSVFGGRDDQFARIEYVPAGEGRLNLNVQIENRARDDTRASDEDNALMAGLWRIDRTAWRGQAALGLYWGMGPGDVRFEFSKLTSVISYPYEPLQHYDAEDYLEGQVEVDLEFFLGELVRVRINPKRDHSDEQTKVTFDEWERWRVRVQEMLAEKYGPPERTRIEFVFGAGEGNNAWRWESDESLILMIAQGHMRRLEYHDLEKGYQVMVAERAHREAKEKARQDRL